MWAITHARPISFWIVWSAFKSLNCQPISWPTIPLHKIKRLRRHGERYFADALRDLSDDRRYAIMSVCALEWQAAISDALVETHDRIVGRTWREAKRLADARIDDAQASIRDTLLSFKDMGTSLLAAHGDNQPLEPVIQWPELESLVAVAGKLTSTMAADPIAHVTGGWGRFRRYVPRMLRVLQIEAAPVCAPLLKAAHLIRDKTAGARSAQRLPAQKLKVASAPEG